MKKICLLALVFILFSATTHAEEHWTQVSTHEFNMWHSLFRSQGVANDGKGNFWYSSMLTLLRTHSPFSASDWFSFPIPNELSQNGANHIGDFEYVNGKLVIPIEDGPRYQHPYIGIVDAKSLLIEKYFPLPRELQRDGVPWVAVEPNWEIFFTSEYHNVTKINVFDLNTIRLLGQIPLSQTIDSIQGAKVYNQNLYMSANAPEGKGFAIYKVDLNSGDLSVVAHFEGDITEVEGLTFVPAKDGVEIYALAVLGSGFKRCTEICIFKLDNQKQPTQESP